MNKSTKMAMNAMLLGVSLTMTLGCAVEAADEGDESVASVSQPMTATSDLGGFFADRANKPALAVGRDANAPCPPGYIGTGAICWLDTGAIGAASDALYSPEIAAASKSAGRAYSFGLGATVAAGSEVSVEAGIYYDHDGEYGWYESTCRGVVTDVSVEMSFSFGNFVDADAIAGDSIDLSAGAGYGVAGWTRSVALDASSGQVIGFVEQVSVGAGVSPIALGVSTCDTVLHPRIAAGNTFYRIASDGSLQRSRHLPNGSFEVVNQPIGTGWGDLTVFAAHGGHVYAIDGGGALRYYRHDAAGNWINGGTVIGSGWGHFTHVFAGQFGEIYAIDDAGQLRLYQHDASLQWLAGNGTVIGTGWSFASVFSGGDGVLYVITDDGALLYYHRDAISGWTETGTQIGSGWHVFASVGSTGDGELYAVTQNGDILFYRHGDDHVWTHSVQVGNGWSFDNAGLISAPSSF